MTSFGCLLWRMVTTWLRSIFVSTLSRCIDTTFEVLSLQSFGVVFGIASERNITFCYQQQDRHGAPGGCAVAELFLVFFELFYLFLVHYPMSVKQVRSGGKSECDVYRREAALVPRWDQS